MHKGHPVVCQTLSECVCVCVWLDAAGSLAILFEGYERVQTTPAERPVLDLACVKQGIIRAIFNLEALGSAMQRHYLADNPKRHARVCEVKRWYANPQKGPAFANPDDAKLGKWSSTVQIGCHIGFGPTKSP